MIDTAKPLLRKKMKRQLVALPADAFYGEGVRGAALIQRLPLWKQCQTVLLFLSTPDEIDTSPLLKAALADGKRVFAPRVVSDTPDTTPGAIPAAQRRLRFFRVYGTDGPWQYGAYHIREPLTARAEDGLAPEHFPALIITPGMAFDREGRRLGHGRGYYDRFFAELDAQGLVYTTIGLCLEAQVVERVPTGLYDKQMDMVCAEDIYFSQGETP
jgi:5-formyltetrahydrofolate cyclo-ligase